MTRSREELEHYVNELEQQIELLTAERSTLKSELESLSYSVSHDLRAPLRSIHGFSKILLNKYHEQLDETGQDYLQRVVRASNRMGELIEDLLGLSRISRAELTFEAVDMRQLAKDAMQELCDGDVAHDICFEVEPLPCVRGDRKLLGTVFHKLLDNALKFSAKESQPCIRVSSSEADGEVTYTVADNGVGFDMAYADKLFGAFQRLHTEDEFQGRGIGLVTVQRILHRHGGSIYAEAESGVGASFHFVLHAAPS